jgi:hypothetical protein
MVISTHLPPPVQPPFYAPRMNLGNFGALRLHGIEQGDDQLLGHGREWQMAVVVAEVLQDGTALGSRNNDRGRDRTWVAARARGDLGRNGVPSLA